MCGGPATCRYLVYLNRQPVIFKCPYCPFQNESVRVVYNHLPTCELAAEQGWHPGNNPPLKSDNCGHVFCNVSSNKYTKNLV